MPGACQNLEKIIGPLELGVPNGFKPLCVVAGNLNRVIWNKSWCS